MADKAVRDLKSILKNVGKKTMKYTTGTAKLFLASGKESFNSQMPYFYGTYDTNKELLQDTVKFLRNPADTIHKQVDRAIGSETFGELKKTFKYAWEDLKSGNLYDKDRSRSMGGDFDDMLNDFDIDDSFGGFDFGEFDENGDYTGDESESSDESLDMDKDIAAQVEIAQIEDEHANARTNATIDAITNSTTAIINTDRFNSQNSLRMQIKQHSQAMNMMQNMLSTQAATLATLNESMQAMLQVTREVSTQQLAALNEIKSLVSDIKVHLIPPKEETRRRDENEIFGINGELNIKNYLKNIVKRVDDEFNISSMISMGTGGMQIKDMLQMIQDNPLQLVTDLIVGRIVPTKLKEHMKKTNEGLSAFLPALLTRFFNEGRDAEFSDSDDMKSTLKKYAAKFLGVESKSRTYIDTARANINAQAVFTTKFTTAVEEVIPMWLSRIDSHLTGAPLMVYDYRYGKLVSAASVVADTTKQTSSLGNKMSESMRNIQESASKNITFQTRSERERFNDYLYAYLQSSAENSNFVDPFKDKEEFLRFMPSKYTTDDDSDKFYEYLVKSLKGLNPTDLTKISSDIIAAHRSRTRATEYANKDLFNNGTIAAYAGFLDPDLVGTIQDYSKNSSKYLTPEDLNRIQRDHQGNLVKRGAGVAATNSILNDILGTLKKGILTFSYNIGSAETSEEVHEIFSSLKNQRESQINLETNIASALAPRASSSDYRSKYSDSDREKYKEDIIAKYGEKEFKMILGSQTSSWVTADEALDIVIDTMLRNNGDLSSITKSDSYIQYRKDKLKESNDSNKVKDKVNNIYDKSGVGKIFAFVQAAGSKPFEWFDKALEATDAFMFRALYGKDALQQVDFGREGSILEVVSKTMHGFMDNMKTFFRDSVMNPIKSWLFDKEEGIINRIENTFKEKIWEPVKSKFKETKDKVMTKIRGTYNEETKQYEGGKFSEQFNATKNLAMDSVAVAKNRVSDAINKLLYGDYRYSHGKAVVPDAQDEYGEPVYEYGGVIGNIRKG